MQEYFNEITSLLIGVCYSLLFFLAKHFYTAKEELGVHKALSNVNTKAIKDGKAVLREELIKVDRDTKNRFLNLEEDIKELRQQSITSNLNLEEQIRALQGQNRYHAKTNNDTLLILTEKIGILTGAILKETKLDKEKDN